MGHPSGKMTFTADEMRMLRVQRVSGRSDLFPRLVAMQKMIGAQHFAVYRVSGFGLPAKQRLLCELENWGASNASNSKALLDAYGNFLIDHIDRSVLPLTWRGTEDDDFGSTSGCSAFLHCLAGQALAFSGIAFPVRLGAVGNGYIVFTADHIDLTIEMVIELHGRSCQIMMSAKRLPISWGFLSIP